MLPNDGRDFLHHQYKKKGASGAEDNVVQLEEELKSLERDEKALEEEEAECVVVVSMRAVSGH